jgi:hypothetical protein
LLTEKVVTEFELNLGFSGVLFFVFGVSFPHIYGNQRLLGKTGMG